MHKYFLIFCLFFFSSFSFAQSEKIEKEKVSSIVSITFDDATASQYSIGYKMMKKYNMKGTLFVTTVGLDSNSFYMRWRQVKEMYENGWELGGHTHNHPNLPKLTKQEIEKEFSISDDLIFSKIGIKPISFALPYGDYNDTVLDIVKARYKNNSFAWGADRGIVNSMDDLDKFGIHRYNVTEKTTSAQLCESVKKADEENEWTVYMFHGFSKGEAGPYQISTKNFEEFLKCLDDMQKNTNMKIMNVDQAVSFLEKK